MYPYNLVWSSDEGELKRVCGVADRVEFVEDVKRGGLS